MIFLHRQNDPEFMSIKDVDGIELDVRSIGERLILTHDRIKNEQASIFASDVLFLEEQIQFLKDYTVIVNVKESGLEEQIADLFEDNNIKYYFLDSQIPDIVRLSKQERFKGKFIIRVSDFESINYNLFEHCKPEYIWVDYQKFDNFKILDYIRYIQEIDSDEYLIKNNIKKILVSPELYGLQNINITKDIIKVTNKELLNRYSVCTKIPDEWRKHV